MRRAGAGLAALMAVAAAPAFGAPSSTIDIPAGRLARAILLLSVQTGADISLSSRTSPDLPVPAVRGRMPVDRALRSLLRPSGARAVKVAADQWRIDPPPTPRPRLEASHASRQTRSAPLPAPSDIIVTATKRDSPLDRLPAAATIISGDRLALDGTPGADALASDLATVGKTHLGTGRDKLFLRGIADSGINGLTQSTVGVYLGDARISYSGPDPDLRLFDVARIEVLEGPQGTLYGAGALGGIIRVVRNPPDLRDLGGSVTLGAATTAHGRPSGDGNAVLNLPLITDRLGLRVLAYGETDGGYIDDSLRHRRDINKVDVRGGRATLRARLGNHLVVDFGATGQRIDGADAQYADRDAPPLTRASSTDQGYISRFARGEFTLIRETGGTSLIWSSAISRQTLVERFDGTPANLPGAPVEPILAYLLDTRVTLLTSELRASHRYAGGASWVLGASLLRDRVDVDRTTVNGMTATPLAAALNQVVEGTIYGEATLPLTRNIRLTMGGRAGFSTLSAGLHQTPPDPGGPSEVNGVGDRHEHRILPSVALDWNPGPATLVFLRYQQAYRPGGVYISFGVPSLYDGDRLAAIEFGVRHRIGDRVSLNATLSRSRWTNIQADTAFGLGFPITTNIGDGRIESLEIGLGWRPTPGLRVDASGLLNRSRLTDDALTISALPREVPLPNVAKVNAAASLQYSHGLTPSLSAALSARLRYYGPSTLGIGGGLGAEQGGYVDSLIGVRLNARHFTVDLTIDNPLDSTGNQFALGNPFLFYRGQVTPQRPRAVRIAITRAF
ncbi:MAG: TonB-dependent receptor, plug [Bradyrhizobium sp.]|nr:TonB-dependent receptor, plug [Bradyrhizobium sp.]